MAFAYKALLHYIHCINCSTQLGATSGFVSRLYWFLLQHSYRPLALDTKWRRDVSDLKPTFYWDKVCINVSLASRNPDHQQIYYNFMHRLYLTPRKLYLMKVINVPICTFCSCKVIGSFFICFGSVL